MIRRRIRHGVAVLVGAATCVLAVGAATGSASAVARPAACRSGYVGLTFDDGPTTTFSAALVLALQRLHVRATFFNIGANEQAHPDLVLKEFHAGMWIGDHTYSHPDLTSLTPLAAYNEMLGTSQINQQITGQTESLFRPPYDDTNATIEGFAHVLGMTEVIWTVDTLDYHGATAAQIATTANTVQPGGILLMHDGYQTTLDALPRIVHALTDRGLCAGQIVPSAAPVVTWWGQTFYAVAAKPTD